MRSNLQCTVYSVQCTVYSVQIGDGGCGKKYNSNEKAKKSDIIIIRNALITISGKKPENEEAPAEENT